MTPLILTNYAMPSNSTLFDPVIPRSCAGTAFRTYINPTGRFVTGGPKGDTGLTGRKIIVDTYGGAAPHGGGAFSGKDPSKVDRSAAYMARFLAKQVVARGWARRALVQLAYAIGVAEPVSFLVETYGTESDPRRDFAAELSREFDLRPQGIIRDSQPAAANLLPNCGLWAFWQNRCCSSLGGNGVGRSASSCLAKMEQTQAEWGRRTQPSPATLRVVRLRPPARLPYRFSCHLRFANSAMATGSAFSKSPDKIWSFNPSTTGSILVTIFLRTSKCAHELHKKYSDGFKSFILVFR